MDELIVVLGVKLLATENTPEPENGILTPLALRPQPDYLQGNEFVECPMFQFLIILAFTLSAIAVETTFSLATVGYIIAAALGLLLLVGAVSGLRLRLWFGKSPN